MDTIRSINETKLSWEFILALFRKAVCRSNQWLVPSQRGRVGSVEALQLSRVRGNDISILECRFVLSTEPSISWYLRCFRRISCRLRRSRRKSSCILYLFQSLSVLLSYSLLLLCDLIDLEFGTWRLWQIDRRYCSVLCCQSQQREKNRSFTPLVNCVDHTALVGLSIVKPVG